MTTDPRDAGIARLVAELAESEAAVEGALMILVQTQAERDAALAQVAGQKAVLSEILEWSHRQFGLYPDWHDRLRKVLGQFDGDAGLSERDRRDAQMRAEGRKEGLREAADAVQVGYDNWAGKPHNAKWVRKIEGTPISNDLPVCIRTAILAAAEKEASP